MLIFWRNKFLLTLLFVFSLSCVTVTGQLNCHDLNISGEPVLGSDLPYCQLQDRLQCCTQNYLKTMKENITTDLIIGMQKDLQTSIIQHWMNAYTNLTATIDEFLVIFLNIFPFPHNLTSSASTFLNTIVKTTLTRQLHPNFTVDSKFNFEEYISNFTTVLIDLFTTNIPYSQPQQLCLNGLLQDHINMSAINITGTELRHIQNIFQSLEKINKFLVNLTSSLSSYSISDQCLSAIISQYCPQCYQPIPLLCDNVCVPVVTGCNSPISDGLLAQLNALWNISRQLFGQTQSLMNCSLQLNTLNILPPSSIHSLIVLSQQKCQVDLLALLSMDNRRKKRSATGIRIPQHLQPAVNLISNVKGVFNYGASNIPNFCTSRATSTNCWNGTSVISNGTLLYQLPITIEDQLHNPVYSFNIYSLYQQAIGLGTPVTFFLQSSNFESTLPNGISIPNITQLTPPLFPTTIVPTTATLMETSTTLTNDPSKTLIIRPTIILIYPSSSTSLHSPKHLTIALILICPLLVLFLVLSNWYQ